MAANERMSFLIQYLRHPRQVGSLIPSGTALADAMTKEIRPQDAPVLELGPGTGVFTRAILARGIAQSDLTLVETNRDFCSMLKQEFPGTNVHCMNATEIGTSALFADGEIGAVVCGVPFLLLTPEEGMAILEGVFRKMAPKASLYQVTYGFSSPFPRDAVTRLGLKATHIGRTFRNAPPASVYRLTRRG